jgi:hypothetical protein
MKTYYLIKSLSQEELEEFEKQLSVSKRKNFRQIIQFLKTMHGKEKVPTLADLQRWISIREKLVPSELQLRNRLSRLNELLYYFIAQKEFEFSLKNNRSIMHQWLTQASHRRKISCLQHDVDEFIKEALRNFMLDEATHMIRGRLISGSTNHESRLVEIEQWILQEKRRVLLHLVAAENMHATAMHRLKTINQENNNTTKFRQAFDYSLDLTELNQEWFVLTYEKSSAALFSHDLQEKARLLQEIVELLNNHKTDHPLFNGARANVLLNVSNVLMQRKEYKRSKNYLKQYIQIQTSEHKEITPIALTNYLVNCCFLEEYEQIVAIYETNKEKFLQSEFFLSSNYIYCVASIFTCRPDKALSSIPDLTTLANYLKVLYRNLYALAFHVRGDNELAKNEIKNLKKSMLGFESTKAMEKAKAVTLLIDLYLSEMTANKPYKNKARTTRQTLNTKPIQELEEEAFAIPIIKWIERNTK